MVSGAVIAIVCLPALLTLVWFFEVLAGCFALRKWGRLQLRRLGRSVTSDDRTYSGP